MMWMFNLEWSIELQKSVASIDRISQEFYEIAVDCVNSVDTKGTDNFGLDIIMHPSPLKMRIVSS